MKKILVTGGAGYIGSVTVAALQAKNYEVIVVDNLSKGHKETVNAKLLIGDLKDKHFLQSINDDFDAVIHFAASTLAGESMQQPEIYFENNILGGLNLLELMRKKNVKNIIFSSTCAIYGSPEQLPVTENEKQKPESVYGESKLMFEKTLRWYDEIYGVKHINLRYFNAAGASLDGKLGEEHSPETHIIPIALEAASTGKSFLLFGTDYPTSDGTCIRDYIHVEDLAMAHIQALEVLDKTQKSDSFNLGTGMGYSNKEVLDMIMQVTGREIRIVYEKRRPGDPPVIYADNKKAKEMLSFSPKHSDLETIVRTAWEFYKKHHS